MKQFFSVISLILFLLSFSCSNEISETDNLGINKQIKIVLVGADTDCSWNIWAWQKNTNKNYSSEGWPGNIKIDNLDENGYLYTSLGLNSNEDTGILFVTSDATIQTQDIIIPANILTNHEVLYFIYGDVNYYTTLDAIKGINNAEITSKNGRTIKAKYFGDIFVKDDIKVTNSTEEEYTVSSFNLDGVNLTINLASGVDISKRPFKISIGNNSTHANISANIIDKVITSIDNTIPLGCTLNNSVATFKTFAPLSIKAELLLFKKSNELSEPDETLLMDNTNDGCWIIEDIDVTSYKYYKYRLTNTSSSYEVSDIHSFAASGDSVASQIIDINTDSKVIPAGWGEYRNPWAGTSYTEAVIYEMHIRDWAKAFSPDNEGKFREITAELSNSGKFATHLKDLGITHVQILPMFDYAEKNSDTNYNWGYNPYHYNVPEGRYVDYGTDKDGTDAVLQLREMIQAFHDNGIAVIMDVVYNHTSGNGNNSLYDMTIPNYFYRQDENGANKNGSGCGNEVATDRTMVRKYIINSLKHWMKDYHINGFRFDLMGLHETSTMKEFYNELVKIDPNVMVYGEPWASSGALLSKKDIDKCSDSTDVNGVACFNDDIRDAIKGSVFDAKGKGHVQGNFNDKKINIGLLGSIDATDGFTKKIGRSLNYVECHDNHTLFDRLALSNFGKVSGLSTSNISVISEQNKLTAAYIFLAQGTPFINGGQEFMRTKKGDHNSYQSNDTINGIDLSFKDTYSDVYNVYKGLIALRKANPSAFGANTTATAEIYNKTAGVTKYTTGDFLVYFNATEKSVEIESTGYTKVIDITSGTPTESTTLPASVPAKSFVILKK